MLDPLDDPERPLFDPLDEALYARARHRSGPPRADAKRRWEDVTLPAALAVGTIIDRGEDFLRLGHLARCAYA